ncbi:MAG: GAP family protein [Nanoarchaeota archaeon]|nr:GAP family protein [Nanoarchaeota archaeon]
MAVEAYLPKLATVITTAAIDSINPCAIGVLILMISVMLAGKQSTKRMLLLGGIYVSAVLVVYLLAGLGLMYYFSTLPLVLAEYISIAVGVLIIIAGLLEIKDYFWYGRWFSLSIPPVFAKMIHNYTSKTTIFGVIFLGAFVSAVELPCTGAPYLAIITLLSQNFDFTAFLLLVLYNIIFVLPLIIILILVASGMKLHEIKKWKQANRSYMRLLIGLLLIALGWMLMLIANGTINLG